MILPCDKSKSALKSYLIIHRTGKIICHNAMFLPSRAEVINNDFRSAKSNYKLVELAQTSLDLKR